MGVYQRPDSKYWWLRLRGGTPERTKTRILIGSSIDDRKASKQVALKLYYEKMLAIGKVAEGLEDAKKPASSFDTFAAWYLEHVVPTHKGHEREAAIVATLRKGFGALALTAIDVTRVTEWMTVRSVNCQPRTVNREVDVLKQILKAAVPKHLASSPIAGMKHLKAKTPERRMMTPAEEKRLLEAASDPAERALLVVGVDALVRMGDLLDLQRTDKHGHWLTIADPKSGAAYKVPLSERAELALNAIPKNGSPYYFERFRGAKKDRDKRGRVRRMLRKLCQNALPPVPFGKKAGGLTFHWATRRTGTTRLVVQKKVDIATVQRIGNWKTPDVLLKIYAESDTKTMLQAVGRVTFSSRRKKTTAKEA